MSTFLKTFVDINKLVVWGDETTDTDTRKPKLVFSFRDGNPRITVYTGATGGTGVISFPSDYPTMVGCMEIFKEIIEGPPGVKASISSMTNVYEDNKPTKEKKNVSTLYIGKSKEGIVYFSLIAEARPKLVFSIKPSTYHVFKDNENNVVPDNVVSCKIAMGLYKLITDVISNVLVNYTEQDYEANRKAVPVKSRESGNTKDATSEIINSLEDIPY